ncbi:MAG TPA: hypothetical protein VES01_02740 [Dermatophilaceae bacterium]|nr:hypothetical protein [Dermatophilaceae bacterium]
MLASLGWGAVAAVPLIMGAVLALVRSWSDRLVGTVLAFGAGALLASVSFELAEEGVRSGGALPVALGLAAGALAFFTADRALERWGARHQAHAAGLPLALGALLDGVPEQLVLGFGLASGAGVSVGLLVAIFLSNLPEAIGSSADMRGGGSSRKMVLTLWVTVAAVCALATVLGYVLSTGMGPALTAGIDGFAAGALLVMLSDSMIPEAREKASDIAGLATVVGFALAAGLSLLS